MSHFRRIRNRRGFTMIELMVVVVIVAILAGVAIPIYGKYIKNSRLTEASAKMGEIITAAKAYAMENQDASGNPTWPSAAGGIVDLTSTELFSYAITAGGGGNANTTAFTITATGIAAKKMAGVTVAISVPNINSSGGAPTITGL
jgi:prepilin-type N-terminal cleavage/methylation domain-containing protein